MDDYDVFDFSLKKFGPNVLNYYKRAINNRDKIDDLYQEWMIQLWRKIRSGYFDPFRKGASNLCLLSARDLYYIKFVMVPLRDRLETTVPEILDAGPDLLDPERIVSSREVYEKVYTTIEYLPGRQGEIFRMTLRGLENGEISNVLGIKEGNVKSQSYNAKKILERRLPPSILKLAKAA